MFEQIKTALRYKHNALDDEIKNNISTCLLLLKGVGIADTFLKEDTEDKAIIKACELYCKWQMNFDGQAERYQRAYEGLRDFLSLGGDYTGRP